MSTISKTTYTFTVLHRTDTPLYDLQEALSESWDGHAVGLEGDPVTTEVPDGEVASALQKLGNDGEFFDEDLGVDKLIQGVFIEPLVSGAKTYGPYPDEISASYSMDELGLTDTTHKLVWREAAENEDEGVASERTARKARGDIGWEDDILARLTAAEAEARWYADEAEHGPAVAAAAQSILARIIKDENKEQAEPRILPPGYTWVSGHLRKTSNEAEQAEPPYDINGLPVEGGYR